MGQDRKGGYVKKGGDGIRKKKVSGKLDCFAKANTEEN